MNWECKGRPGRTGRSLVALILLCGWALAATGCVLPAYWQAEKEEKAKREAERIADEQVEMRVLEPGEAQTVTFPADGIWHRTPFMIRPGDMLRIAPTEDSSFFPTGAISFRIGNKRFTLVGEKMDFVVTEGGPFMVRFNRQVSPGYAGTAQIFVQNMTQG